MGQGSTGKVLSKILLTFFQSLSEVESYAIWIIKGVIGVFGMMTLSIPCLFSPAGREDCRNKPG